MTRSGIRCADLPNALSDNQEFARRLGGRRPAVFLDYDGTLTPIVGRPEDAVISASMRAAVQELAQRCPVCVVSGRDRAVVQELMGIDDLVVASSHGFDIFDPRIGTIDHPAASGFEELLSRVTTRLRAEIEPIPGAVIEPKKASVAVHYRRATEPDQETITAVVDRLLADLPDQLKVTPGKMVYEIQPKLDWHKGKAVLYLLETLKLDRDDTAALYLGDDITDEDAFRALAGRGIGIVVASDAEEAARQTAADFVLDSIEEVEQFLRSLAR